MDSHSFSPPSLTRSRVAIAVISVLATLCVLNHYRRQGQDEVYEEAPTGSLHRSNAVRRSRARSNGNESAPSENDDPEPFDENRTLTETQTLQPTTDGETAIEDRETVEANWWEDPEQMAPQRAGQNIVSLLFRVSEDNARRNAYVHRGCACNACGIVPIRGIRYRCANCADFDLCETCESQGLHLKTHIFYKVRIPAPSFGPRQMQPVWYLGDPETCLRSLPRHLMPSLSAKTGFERPELEASTLR